MVMADSGDDGGYPKAFDMYFQLGWRGILPLRHGSKWPPPKDTTGYGNPDPSYPDLMAWAEDPIFRNGNLALRLPDGVIGIDVDEYGAKAGAKTFAEAIRRWGPLPPAPRTTSREGNAISGIRLFAVPLGTMLTTKMGFAELGLGDVEIIQPHHRYAVSWPSIHPEGGQYRWRDDDDQPIGIPNLGDLPALPQTWIDGLAIAHESNLEFAPIDVAVALTEGTPSEIVRARLSQAFQELNMPGCSRHDTCTKHVMALMRYGKSGEPGVAPALVQLCKVLIAIRLSDGSGDEAKTKAEFRRMITNDNIARELAKPGYNDWIRDLIVESAPAIENPQVDQRQAPPNPQVDLRQAPESQSPPTGEVGGDQGPTADTSGSVIVDDSAPKSHLEEIEQGFWQSRESLAMIYQTALARMAPPWGTLGHCTARALSMIPPHVTLPPIISGPGSLNWFVATVAKASAGKGASKSAADVLVPKTGFLHRKVGSGEGIIAAYGRIGDDDSDPEHPCIMFTTNEIDTLKALSNRSSSTTLPILREGFFGEDLGFAYSAKDKRRLIPEHSYRMTLVIAAQPDRMDWLLADVGGGTPQRFMWFPAGDKRISRKKPWETGPLTLPRPGEWLYPRTIIIPPEAQELIEVECEKRAQEDGEAMDGHALFCREKFAFGLTVLDGRTQMTSEDWELSGIAANVSLYTRQMAQDAVAAAARIEALERGDIRGVELAATNESKEYEEAERIRHALRWCLDKIEAAGVDGISNRDLQRSADSKRTRRWIGAALSIGQSNGLIRPVDGTTNWVKI